MWDDEFERLANSFAERFGEEELEKALSRAVSVAIRQEGRPSAPGERKTATSENDFWNVVREELQRALSVVH